MNRATRSQQPADENATSHFRFTRRGSGIGGGKIPPPPPAVPGVVPTKPTLNTRKSSGRTALGDISNQIPKPKDDQQLPKKKRLDEVGVDVPSSTTTATASFPQQHYIEVPDDDGVEEVEEPAQPPTVAPERPERPIPPPPQERPMPPQDQQHNTSDDDDQKIREVDMERSIDSVADLKLALEEVEAAVANNPQFVPEYIGDIMRHFFDSESKRLPNPNYMQRQTDINTKMREILVDWLVEVHLKFKLQSETLYLTVNVIDRFLERRAVSRTKLQLVGCTAMLIASKYEEIYAPELKDFVYISDQAYTNDQILAMESIILNTLGFHLTVPSTLRFGERLCRVAKTSPQAEMLIRYLMELTLQDSKFLRYKPSEIAAAAAYIGLRSCGVAWDALMERHCGYSLDKLSEVIADLHQLAVRDPPKYRAVRKKYMGTKFLEVAKMQICDLP